MKDTILCNYLKLTCHVKCITHKYPMWLKLIYHVQPQGLECWQILSVRAKLEDLLNARSGPILLFIDDAWTGEMIDNSPEFKRTKGSKLLVTSRFNLKPNWIRIEMNQTTNYDAAAQLLARKAANNPNETKFPLGCKVSSFPFFHHWKECNRNLTSGKMWWNIGEQQLREEERNCSPHGFALMEHYFKWKNILELALSLIISKCIHVN